MSSEDGGQQVTLDASARPWSRLISGSRTVAVSVPALLLALLSLASLAYFFASLSPLAGWIETVLPIDPGDAGPDVAVLSALGMGAGPYIRDARLIRRR